jgi:hypothetical protein
MLFQEFGIQQGGIELGKEWWSKEHIIIIMNGLKLSSRMLKIVKERGTVGTRRGTDGK